jgi:hypothetical protein
MQKLLENRIKVRESKGFRAFFLSSVRPDVNGQNRLKRWKIRSFTNHGPITSKALRIWQNNKRAWQTGRYGMALPVCKSKCNRPECESEKPI